MYGLANWWSQDSESIVARQCLKCLGHCHTSQVSLLSQDILFRTRYTVIGMPGQFPAYSGHWFLADTCACNGTPVNRGILLLWYIDCVHVTGVSWYPVPVITRSMCNLSWVCCYTEVTSELIRHTFSIARNKRDFVGRWKRWLVHVTWVCCCAELTTLQNQC